MSLVEEYIEINKIELGDDIEILYEIDKKPIKIKPGIYEVTRVLDYTDCPNRFCHPEDDIGYCLNRSKICNKKMPVYMFNSRDDSNVGSYYSSLCGYSYRVIKEK